MQDLGSARLHTRCVESHRTLDAYEKVHGCAAHEQADLLIADAVANLPEAVKQQHIALFDAVYGKHAFDMLEHEMQAEDSG